MVAFAASLVIGGTGMLAEATRWLAARSQNTILVARRASAFAAPGALLALDADWNSAAFAPMIVSALERSASAGAALLWLHDPSPVLAWLLPHLRSARIVLVLGSLDGRPQDVGELVTVRLGSMLTPHGRRWLTHSEISAAAIASLEDGTSRVVGDLQPLG